MFTCSTFSNFLPFDFRLQKDFSILLKYVYRRFQIVEKSDV